MTAWRYFVHDITSGAQYTLLVGVLSFFIIRYRKLVYASPEGIVRETRTWLTNHREVMRWGEVQFVTIMYRGSEAMVFMERDSFGWKVLFDREQIPALREIFAKYIPGVDIDTDEMSC